MNLIQRIALSLALALSLLISVWAVFFYFATMDEINDETDDSLVEYSSDLIRRMLAGAELPSEDNGTNNAYYIREVPENYVRNRDWIIIRDEDKFITEKSEYESARVIYRIFVDKDDVYHEIVVAIPTFEKDDLSRSIFWWAVILYVVLLVLVLGITLWVFAYNMRPFKALLKWLDDFVPGQPREPLPSDSGITEYRRLSDMIGKAAARLDNRFLEQKRFIGNASHELQTPLASCINRIEMILDSEVLTEEQGRELAKVLHSLNHLVRLNKTLLMLTRIENGQFPEETDVDFSVLADNSASMLEDIYGSRHMTVRKEIERPFVFRMNEHLAGVLVSNLFKNAFVHSPSSSEITVEMDSSGFSVSNPGQTPLDAERIFTRFYQGPSKVEGSTGLGLAMVDSVCRNCGLSVEYSFADGRHKFTISAKK